jgi:hypothetical protein
VKPVRPVWGESLETGHGADLRGDPNDVAAVELKMLNRAEPSNTRGKSDDLSALLRVQVSEWLEHFPPISDSLIDQCEEVLPPLSRSVLTLAMEKNLVGLCIPVLVEAPADFEAIMVNQIGLVLGTSFGRNGRPGSSEIRIHASTIERHKF